MVKIVTLGEIIANLDDLDDDEIIFAKEPWNSKSPAALILDAEENEIDETPKEFTKIGLIYFLEVDIAREFVEDWIESQDSPPKPEAICNRLIEYAINDA